MAKKEKQQSEMDARLSIKLPSELLNKAREKSAKTGVSISFVVRKAIEGWIKEK